MGLGSTQQLMLAPTGARTMAQLCVTKGQRPEAPIPPLRRARCTETDSIRTAYVFYANRWYHKIHGTAGTEPGTTKTAATKPLSAGAMAQTFPTLAAQYTEAGSMRTCVLCEPFYANQW